MMRNLFLGAWIASRLALAEPLRPSLLGSYFGVPNVNTTFDYIVSGVEPKAYYGLGSADMTLFFRW